MVGQFLVIFETKLIDLVDAVLAFSKIDTILISFSIGLQRTFAEFRGVRAKSIVAVDSTSFHPFSRLQIMVHPRYDFPIALIVSPTLSATYIAIAESTKVLARATLLMPTNDERSSCRRCADY